MWVNSRERSTHKGERSENKAIRVLCCLKRLEIYGGNMASDKDKWAYTHHRASHIARQRLSEPGCSSLIDVGQSDCQTSASMKTFNNQCDTTTGQMERTV